MRTLGAFKTVLALAILAMTAGIAMASEGGKSLFMAVKGKTAQPVGHHEFCLAHVEECAVLSDSRVHVRLDERRLFELDAINRRVNTGVRPATDQDIYGRAEVWDFPMESGDCEDFVLLKRKLLIDKGWPAAALLITVVRQENGDGHAVLTVTTNRGDLVLDNLDQEIRLWSATAYRYLKRQSEYDSGAWVSIEDGRAQQVGSLQ